MLTTCTDPWVPILDEPPFDTLADARAHVKDMDLGAGGRWKADRKSPGNGKTTGQYQCNAHVDCGLRVKIMLKGDGFLLFQKGEHGEEEQEKSRKNAVIPYKQEEALRDAVLGSTTPGQHFATLTRKELERSGKRGLPDPPKRPEGGLQGERAAWWQLGGTRWGHIRAGSRRRCRNTLYYALYSRHILDTFHRFASPPSEYTVLRAIF